MSSHREAPSISQDPVADNADTYAFVSPDDPTTVTIITNYVPLQGPPGGPNFFEFGDDVLYSIYIDNDGDALPEIDIPVPVPHDAPERGHVPLQHRADRVARPTRTGTSGSSIPSPSFGQQDHNGDGDDNMVSVLARDLRLPAVQHRSPLDAELRLTRLCGGASTAVRRDGVRRPAQRRLLRRPRRDLRPRRHQGAPGAPPDHVGPGDQRRSVEDAEYPHDRDQGADHAPDAKPGPVRATRRIRTRCSGSGAVPAGVVRWCVTGTGRMGAARGCRSRASVTRCSTRSSSRSGTRTAGTRLDPINDNQFEKYVNQPELAKLLPVLYPGVFPNLAAYTKNRARPRTRSCSRAFRAGSSPDSRTSRHRLRRTCCGSTSRSRRRPSNPNALGLIGGDAAGYPNGRRCSTTSSRSS